MTIAYEAQNESNYAECAGLAIAIPEIIGGFWSDPKTKVRITEAYYSDKVKFTIGTNNIPDGTFLELKLKDYDPVNSDDQLNSFAVQVFNNVAEIEFVTDEKWNEAAKYENDEVVETFFEINGDVEGENVTANYPENKEDYLTLYEQEVKITVIVELPHSKETGMGAKGLAGHTAMAIGDQFFDYGPDYYQTILDENEYDFNNDGDKNDIVDLTNQNLSYKFSTGKPWWGDFVAKINACSPKQVKLNQVLKFILQDYKMNNVYGEVNKVEFYVSKKQASEMIDWWENRYEHLKVYSVYPWTGEQCTTSVKTALQAGGVNVPDVTQKPIGILKDFRNIIRSTSVKHRNEKAEISIIKSESKSWKPANP